MDTDTDTKLENGGCLDERRFSMFGESQVPNTQADGISRGSHGSPLWHNMKTLWLCFEANVGKPV